MSYNDTNSRSNRASNPDSSKRKNYSKPTGSWTNKGKATGAKRKKAIAFGAWEPVLGGDSSRRRPSGDRSRTNNRSKSNDGSWGGDQSVFEKHAPAREERAPRSNRFNDRSERDNRPARQDRDERRSFSRADRPARNERDDRRSNDRDERRSDDRGEHRDERGARRERGGTGGGRDGGRRNDRGDRNERSFRDRSSGGGRSRGRGKGKKKGKGIDYDLSQLNHVGRPVAEVKYNPVSKFEDWPIHPQLKQALAKAGFEFPTEIQEKSFPLIAAMKDVVGIANTGTGKTGAFLLPIIDALLEGQSFQTLVVVPTRELALQVEQEFKRFTKGMKLYNACFIGGTSISKDMRTLRRRQDIIVGTPGRLVDLCKRRALQLRSYSTLILDEYDRMLDMGFKDDLDFLINQMGDRDQTLLFSATVQEAQKRTIQEMMHNPTTVQVSSGKSTAEHIDQELLEVRNEDEKMDQLMEILEMDEVEKVLIFERTKRRCDKLGKILRREGQKVDEIHGDKTQNYRQRALEAFKNGKVDILVATDVAARGLDIKDVTHVINFHPPQDYETYIHRIGRTGRAGKTGKAYTFSR